MRASFGLWRFIVTALLALMLTFVSAAPAHASLIDCVKAAVPLDDAVKTAELAAKVAACTGPVAGGDAVMALTIATMAALVAAGQIPADTDGCQAAVNNVIGQVLAKALVDSGLAGVFGSDAEKMLSDLANGVGNQTFTDIVNTIPALQVLLQEVMCGCTILGAPGEAKKIVEDYLESVDGCADFFEDIGEVILDFLEDVGCFVASLFGDCSDDSDPCWEALSGLHGMESFYWFCKQNAGDCAEDCALLNWGSRLCRGLLCDAGQQCGGAQDDVCVPCAAAGAHAVTLADGRCGCEPPYTPIYWDSPGGKVLRSCYCEAPNQDVGWACFCPKNQELREGHCVPCSDFEIYKAYPKRTCEPCPLGFKADAFHSKCVPACDAGAIQISGACTPCAENTRAVYLTGSLGSCEDCPDGTSALAGSTQCIPLACGDNGYQDPDNPHACKSCPPGQIFIPTTLVPMPGASEIDKKVAKVAGHCGCPENTKQVGETCECPAGSLKAAGGPFAPDGVGCACPVGAHVDKASFSCKCAAGATLDKTGTKCVCPPGARIENDICVRPSKQVVPLVPTDCAALGPSFITNPKNRAACVRCPAGRIANEARTACVRAPVQRIVPPPRRGDFVRPVLRCPPRMTPNAAGTACVPRYAPPPPQFRTPRAIPPGFGRMPGPRPGMMMVPSMRRR